MDPPLQAADAGESGLPLLCDTEIRAPRTLRPQPQVSFFGGPRIDKAASAPSMADPRKLSEALASVISCLFSRL